MIAEAQITINELQIDAKYEMAKHVNKITTKHTQKPTKEELQKLKTLRNINRKFKNSNIIHVKANKGNGLVLINKNEYIKKNLKFIKENNFLEIKEKPTTKYQREIKQLIKSSSRSFKTTTTEPSMQAPIKNSSQQSRNKIAYS